MTTPTDLVQVYILLSYEKLQRSSISPRQRPIEASLRNRLLVWRFLKKIENDPMTIIKCEEEVFKSTYDNNSNNLSDNDSWIVDFNRAYDNSNNVEDDLRIDMEIDSDLIGVISNDELNGSPCEMMSLEPSSDVSMYLKRAIGAERRQKVSSDNFHLNESHHSNLHLSADRNSYENSEDFFHELCAELTNTNSALVSSTSNSALNFPGSHEQTLIH